MIPLQTITSLKSVDIYLNSTMLVTFSRIRAFEPVLPINKHLSQWTRSHQSNDYIPSISILIDANFLVVRHEIEFYNV